MFVEHSSFTTVANYGGARLWMMKLIVEICKFLALKQELETHLSFIAVVDR